MLKLKKSQRKFAFVFCVLFLASAFMMAYKYKSEIYKQQNQANYQYNQSDFEQLQAFNNTKSEAGVSFNEVNEKTPYQKFISQWSLDRFQN